MNPIRKMTGNWSPTSLTVGPSAPVRVYAGAMVEMPRTTTARSPNCPVFSPLPLMSCDSAASAVLLEAPVRIVWLM